MLKYQISLTLTSRSNAQKSSIHVMTFLLIDKAALQYNKKNHNWYIIKTLPQNLFWFALTTCWDISDIILYYRNTRFSGGYCTTEPSYLPAKQSIHTSKVTLIVYVHHNWKWFLERVSEFQYVVIFFLAIFVVKSVKWKLNCYVNFLFIVNYHLVFGTI